MAKAAAAQPDPSPQELLELAARAIAGITGCGIAPARSRARKLPDKSVAQIANLERAGNRGKVPAILNAVAAPSKSAAKQ